jgi:hypothetical protein
LWWVLGQRAALGVSCRFSLDFVVFSFFDLVLGAALFPFSGKGAGVRCRFSLGCELFSFFEVVQEELRAPHAVHAGGP